MFNFDYDKLYLKEITILVPRGTENLVSALTPILGLYGINVKDFLADFEIKTQFMSPHVTDLIIPARVKISKIKTFEILIKTPYLANIVTPEATILETYKLFLVKSTLIKNKLNFYYIFRKYLNQLSNVTYLNNINNYYLLSKVYLGTTDFVKSKILSNKFSLIKSYERLKNLKYGVFFSWNNTNSYYINLFQRQLTARNLNFFKLNKFSKQLIPSPIVVNTYVFSSSSLSSIIVSIQIFLGLLRRSNYYPLFYKFGNNLISSLNTDFIKLTLNIFMKIRFHLKIYLIRLLNWQLQRILNLSNQFQLRMLLFINAYLSSNCKISAEA